MHKGKLSITLDKDLIEFAREYAQYQRTSVSEIFSQFVLNLKRTKQNDPTDIILEDPDFQESLLDTISRIRTGSVKWHSYEEVFHGSSV